MSGLRFLTQARENGVGGEIAAQNVKNEVVATNAIKILFATRTRIQLVIREQRYATDRVVDDDTNFTYRAFTGLFCCRGKEAENSCVYTLRFV